MEISEDNLRTLGQYLQQTLSPDVNVRRPGMKLKKKSNTFSNLFNDFS